MGTELAIVGLSHRTASAEVRERLSFSADQLKSALKSLSSEFSERAILFTCNRTEIYVSTKLDSLDSRGDLRGAPYLEDRIADFLARSHGLDPRSLRPHLYRHVGLDAVRHLCRVASGLDSLILGEPQILGQVKEAYREAVEATAVGKVLHRLFHYAFEVVKRVRSETAIGREAASVGSAAVKLASNIFPDLSDRNVLILGAGDIGELVLKHLLENGVKEALVANRNYHRAENLARAFDGRAIRFEDRYTYLAESDVVIAATGALGYVVSPEEVRAILPRRVGRPILFIDLSLPRNVDPEVGKLKGVSLYDLDHLGDVVEGNMETRRREAKKAEAIIGSEVERFMEWLEIQEQVVPTILALRKMAEEIREKELSKTLAKLNNLSPEVKQRIEYLSESIVNKLVHYPIVRLKEAVEEGRGEGYLRVIQELFGLDISEEV